MATAKQVTSGTHRALPLHRTIARARALMPRLGITRLANLTGLDVLGIPVYAAIRPNGRSLSTSQGKGTSHAAAQASALMESIETWHAEHLELPRVRASWQAMTRPHVDPRRLARAAPLASGQTWSWVPGRELMSGRELWVPEEAVTLDCVFSQPPVFDVSSNGLASGNHPLEAIIHGLCEVVERDAEARWRKARGQARLDLDSVDDADCRRLLAKMHAQRVHVTVWDLTSDVGLPVYGAAIMEDPGEPAWRALGLYQGFGCHLDASVALARALTEAAQTRLTYIAGSRDDFFDFDYARATDAELLAEIWADVTRPPRVAVDLRQAPRLATPTLEGDLEVVLARLQAAKVKQAIAVDLTREELGVPVFKTLIPGRATQVELMG